MSGFALPLGIVPAGALAGSTSSPGLAALALGRVLRALAGGLDVMAPQCHGRTHHHKSGSSDLWRSICKTRASPGLAQSAMATGPQHDAGTPTDRHQIT